MSAISDKNVSRLDHLKQLVEAELAPLRGKMSQNYSRHIESLLRELESVIPDAKLESGVIVKTEAKPKSPETTTIANFFRN